MMPAADLHFNEMTFGLNSSPASISSRHNGVVNIGLADGSVRGMAEWMPEDVIRNLIQPADGNDIPWHYFDRRGQNYGHATAYSTTGY